MTTAWIQHDITIPRDNAERVAARDLAPALEGARNSGLLEDWWYMRKDPFRLRYRAKEPVLAISCLLDSLADEGHIAGWNLGVYEPETAAFGGAEAMDVAHRLFHTDSRHLLTRAARDREPAVGRRETAVLLAGVLMRAASLDWYEQGNVWHLFSQLRPDPPPLNPERSRALTGAMHRLMTVDTRQLTRAPGPLTGHHTWVAAFETAGQDLSRLARQGQLTRGLRSVLAHHLLFHANRAGLPVEHQAAMAARALDAVFHSGEDPVSPLSTIRTTNRVAQVTTPSDNNAVTAEQLRAALTDRLCEQKAINSTAVERAFRTVPREHFLPDVPLKTAYADNPTYTKTDGSGAQISAASQPWIVAMMLEQLGALPGEQIFEAGAGTGVNAAYMATLVGSDGHVVTVDVDDDLVDGARKHLADAGIANVEVVLADGALGHPDGAPYDRVIATVGTSDMPTAWLRQLKPTGRIVVPLRLRGTASRSIAFERGQGGWVSVDSQLAVFMPLRASMDDARRTVTLGEQGDVELQVHKDQSDAVDATTLLGVLGTERHECWTGVNIVAGTTYEYMDLWLACVLPHSLMRMSVADSAQERGVSRMFGWGSMATVDGSSLAYLTIRPAEPSEDGRKTFETGVIGHGPASRDLAELVSRQIRIWDEEFRNRTVRFELPDVSATADPGAGRIVLSRPHHPIIVIWE
ncbi:methyltransferase, FxLD system [Kitasatospora sp. MAP5-34]|uniref:methyltransferase, FxLD system n=1 Tax=Kitasatospora sp. MAP5-34 TaxID=3035102 RepID=UPI002473A676|nr:methyltransferase, FxLD system [Kitasatospora sp. MAP5-34]MDH6579386.1 protein-L-isoaspartate(D-aspartate) O-methyltransferase [Kitasatospora sp. MAP5-34]